MSVEPEDDAIESIAGLTEREIFTLGMLWGIIHDGITVARTKGFDCDMSLFTEADGRYSKAIDVTVEGMTVRLTAVLPSDTEAALLALRHELRPHN